MSAPNSHGQHTPASLADMLEKDYSLKDGASLFLSGHEWELVIAALRSETGVKLCADCGCEMDCLKYGCSKNFSPSPKGNDVCLYPGCSCPVGWNEWCNDKGKF